MPDFTHAIESREGASDCFPRSAADHRSQNYSEKPHSDVGFAADVWGAFLNTFKSQANGAGQLANRVLGTNVGQHDLNRVDDPDSGWGAWSASLIGQSGALALEFLAARKLGAAAKVLNENGGFATTIETGQSSGSRWQSFASRLSQADTPATAVYSGLAFGGFIGGVLTPTNDADHFWSDRLKNTVSSAVAVGAMTGISFGLGRAAASLDSGTLTSTLRNGYFNNAVGGYAGGALGNLTADALNDRAVDWRQANRSGLEFALVGMGTHTLNMLPAQRVDANLTNARYFSDKIGLTKPEPSNGQTVDFRVLSGADQARAFYDTRSSSQSSVSAEVLVQPKIHTLMSGLFGERFTKYGAPGRLLLSHGSDIATTATTADFDWLATCAELKDPSLQARDVFGSTRTAAPSDQRSVWLTADPTFNHLLVSRGTSLATAEGMLKPVDLGAANESSDFPCVHPLMQYKVINPEDVLHQYRIVRARISKVSQDPAWISARDASERLDLLAPSFRDLREQLKLGSGEVYIDERLRGSRTLAGYQGGRGDIRVNPEILDPGGSFKLRDVVDALAEELWHLKQNTGIVWRLADKASEMNADEVQTTAAISQGYENLYGYKPYPQFIDSVLQVRNGIPLDAKETPWADNLISARPTTNRFRDDMHGVDHQIDLARDIYNAVNKAFFDSSSDPKAVNRLKNQDIAHIVSRSPLSLTGGNGIAERVVDAHTINDSHDLVILAASLRELMRHLNAEATRYDQVYDMMLHEREAKIGTRNQAPTD